jgi:hypothetical protein
MYNGINGGALMKMDIRFFFTNRIAFLKWAELHPDNVKELDNFSHVADTSRVFLSPDVNSLFILWDDGEWIQYEIADYARHETWQDLLNEETFDDAWESFEETGERKLLELMDLETMPEVIRLRGDG